MYSQIVMIFQNSTGLILSLADHFSKHGVVGDLTSWFCWNPQRVIDSNTCAAYRARIHHVRSLQ